MMLFNPSQTVQQQLTRDEMEKLIDNLDSSIKLLGNTNTIPKEVLNNLAEIFSSYSLFPQDLKTKLHKTLENFPQNWKTSVDLNKIPPELRKYFETNLESAGRYSTSGTAISGENYTFYPPRLEEKKTHEVTVNANISIGGFLTGVVPDKDTEKALYDIFNSLNGNDLTNAQRIASNLIQKHGDWLKDNYSYYPLLQKLANNTYSKKDIEELKNSFSVLSEEKKEEKKSYVPFFYLNTMVDLWNFIFQPSVTVYRNISGPENNYAPGLGLNLYYNLGKNFLGLGADYYPDESISLKALFGNTFENYLKNQFLSYYFCLYLKGYYHPYHLTLFRVDTLSGDIFEKKDSSKPFKVGADAFAALNIPGNIFNTPISWSLTGKVSIEGTKFTSDLGSNISIHSGPTVITFGPSLTLSKDFSESPWSINVGGSLQVKHKNFSISGFYYPYKSITVGVSILW